MKIGALTVVQISLQGADPDHLLRQKIKNRFTLLEVKILLVTLIKRSNIIGHACSKLSHAGMQFIIPQC